MRGRRRGKEEVRIHVVDYNFHMFFNSSLPFLFRFISVVIKCLIDASSGEPNHLLQSHAPSIIKNIIIPSCVWRAGRSEILRNLKVLPFILLFL